MATAGIQWSDDYVVTATPCCATHIHIHTRTTSTDILIPRTHVRLLWPQKHNRLPAASLRDSIFWLPDTAWWGRRISPGGGWRRKPLELEPQELDIERSRREGIVASSFAADVLASARSSPLLCPCHRPGNCVVQHLQTFPAPLAHFPNGESEVFRWPSDTDTDIEPATETEATMQRGHYIFIFPSFFWRGSQFRSRSGRT